MRKTAFNLFITCLFFVFNDCAKKPADNGVPPIAEPDPGVKKEVQIGRTLAARLAKKYGLIQDKEFTVYLKSVGSSISRLSSRQELDFHFGVLNTSEVNAFACPGGYILVTKGALDLVDNEAELAGILSHEITHVTLQHSGKFEGKRDSILEMIAYFMAPGGDIINELTEVSVNAMVGQFFEQGRKKEEEIESDQAGAMYLSLAGYSVSGASSYLSKMSKAQGNEIVLKTHPPTGERISSLERFISQQGLNKSGKVNREEFQSKYRNFLENWKKLPPPVKAKE
ncbi:MAG TPA: M48 family metalloprotease [Leptospiraceae bacterium]|nr:M48 family metalloprotease [Leptospiraceae bacterium]HNF13651.1 M48 family metalloprotease [Leptospiraceae bacterium]HNF25840.1 M48 family metalloprotease [Leptospiraceae bacterium]HNI97219.1 M48 family metalloprotease [Leptospiraceae bacterium]HNM02204.1 M48 family metalloprotease [Leptospiraceae bacterium]